MKEQIKQLMESLHMNQKAFAQTTGINEGTLSGILNGKTKPSMQTVEAIHNRLTNISIKWLMFGEGPMYENSSRSTPSVKETNGTTTANNNVSGGNLNASGDVDNRIGGVENGEKATPVSAPLLFDVGNATNGSRRPVSGMQMKEREVVKYIDKPARKITEIRVFYDDQTWESFTPKK